MSNQLIDAPAHEAPLDPNDWTELRVLAHRMVDDMLGFLEDVRERPVWQPMPESVTTRFQGPVPIEAEGLARAYDDFRSDVLTYPLGNIHPRFWGWVIGSGLPVGMLAEMLAAGMNPNLGGASHAANLVEAQVLSWFKELLGFPAEASGVLVSGGSIANLVGLTVARNARAEIDLRRYGVAASPRPMTLYASTETHSSIQRAVEILGLGREALRLIPCGSDFRIDLAALADTLAADRAAGRLPFCVVGNAGTTNTGAIDDLAGLARICAEEKLWFHVDGAFGALAALSPTLRPALDGMERTDSVAFDLHKWFYLPIGIGGVLVRDEAAHRGAFTLTPDYLRHAERGPAAGERWFSDYGPELSRPFRALKVWLALKTHGAAAFGRAIDENVEQAHYLAALVSVAPDLELLAPVALNIVCFRYRVAELTGAALDDLNQELLLRLQESGVALPSNTTVHGRYGLRVAITNHRSRHDDFDLLVSEVRRLGQDVEAAMRGAASATTA